MQVSLSVSLFSFFLKYEHSSSRCHLGTKALVSVGMVQMNIPQDSTLASQWCSILQNQNLYQGFVLGFFLRLFQSMPLSWKSLQVNTTKTTRSIAIHHILRFYTKPVAAKLGTYPILTNFSSYSDSFPKLTLVSLSLPCPRGERRSHQHTRLLTNVATEHAMGTTGCSPQPVLLPEMAIPMGLAPSRTCALLRRASRCGHSLLTPPISGCNKRMKEQWSLPSCNNVSIKALQQGQNEGKTTPMFTTVTI